MMGLSFFLMMGSSLLPAASAQALPQSYSLANYEVDGLVYL
jgi:hypothetical protein